MNSQALYLWSDPGNWYHKTQIELPNEKIQQISLGEKHILIRTQTKLFGFGQNNKGQLGNDDCPKGLIQLKLKLCSYQIKQISCGWNHTLLLDNFGNVYSAGQGKNGALGYARGIDSYSFKQIPNLKNINYISAGYDHSLALNSIKVYGWGNSMDGQLGIPKQKIWYEPQQLFIYPSKTCYAGFKYSLFITDKGVYGTGQNDEGQLGLGNKIKIKIPKKITQFKQQIIQVGGNSKYSIFKTSQNSYYLAGTGCFGQYLYPTKIKHLQNCKDMALGKEYAIIKTQDNTIQLWDSTKQSSQIDTSWCKNIYRPVFFSGPKMLICHTLKEGDISLDSNQFQIKINTKSNKQKNLIAHSSIQYDIGYNNEADQINIDNQIYGQQIYGQQIQRKKSQNKSRSKLGLDYSHISEMRNNTIDQQSLRYGYNQNSRISNENDRKQSTKYLHEQIYSPHFKRQSNSSNSQQFSYNDKDGSDRISQFKYFNLEKQRNNRNYKPQVQFKSRQNQFNSASSSQLAYSEDTNKFFNRHNHDNKLTNKQKLGRKQLYEPLDNNDDIIQRLNYLQKQNKKKDEYIRKMRRQLFELSQIVQSDACLKQILQKKNSKYFSKSKQQIQQVPQVQSDIFETNIQKLRAMLGKTTSSFTYS